MHVVETDAPLDKVWKQLRDVDGWSGLDAGHQDLQNARVARRDDADLPLLRDEVPLLPCDLVLAEETDSRGAQVLRFDLDRASPAVKRCSGAWVVERVDGKTRVSLAASIEATRVVPGMIVDMVATKALGSDGGVAEGVSRTLV